MESLVNVSFSIFHVMVVGCFSQLLIESVFHDLNNTHIANMYVQVNLLMY